MLGTFRSATISRTTRSNTRDSADADFGLRGKAHHHRLFDDDERSILAENLRLPQERILRIATSDNSGRWATPACGPVSEIFYDHGDHIPAVRPARPTPTATRSSRSGISFQQFEALPGGERINLPRPSVDTAWASASPPCCRRAR